MSDMTDEESKAYFDGRDEGFNDAKEVIKELHTRVAELQCPDCLKYKDGHSNPCDKHKPYEGLQNRLSTVEAENKWRKEAMDNYDSRLTVHLLRNWDKEKRDRFCVHILGDDVESLKSKLSTLLKASEEMEKALEEILATDTMITAVHAADKSYEIAKQALADFRALKETK